MLSFGVTLLPGLKQQHKILETHLKMLEMQSRTQLTTLPIGQKEHSKTPAIGSRMQVKQSSIGQMMLESSMHLKMPENGSKEPGMMLVLF